MVKTRDLFNKIRDTKGTVHAKMGYWTRENIMSGISIVSQSEEAKLSYLVRFSKSGFWVYEDWIRIVIYILVLVDTGDDFEIKRTHCLLLCNKLP